MARRGRGNGVETICIAAALVGLLAAGRASSIEIEYVEVRDEGNEPDFIGREIGGVDYPFAISKYEITVSQYVAFLNEVANEVDAHGLYDEAIPGIDFPPVPVGFERLYEVEPGFANKPVTNVSFWDAVRFANWLHNGQPRGLQNASTTEDGAYQLLQALIDANTVVRDPAAAAFLPNADEWHKAAYYVPDGDRYRDFPTGDALPTCSAPGPSAGTANCGGVVGGPVDVGSYPGSPSAYGTFDQGGNVWEWTEEVFLDVERVSQGGAYDSAANVLASNVSSGGLPGFIYPSKGFRVAQRVPEPAGAGLAALAALAGLAARRRV